MRLISRKYLRKFSLKRKIRRSYEKKECYAWFILDSIWQKWELNHMFIKTIYIFFFIPKISNKQHCSTLSFDSAVSRVEYYASFFFNRRSRAKSLLLHFCRLRKWKTVLFAARFVKIILFVIAYQIANDMKISLSEKRHHPNLLLLFRHIPFKMQSQCFACKIPLCFSRVMSSSMAPTQWLVVNYRCLINLLRNWHSAVSSSEWTGYTKIGLVIVNTWPSKQKNNDFSTVFSL